LILVAASVISLAVGDRVEPANHSGIVVMSAAFWASSREARSERPWAALQGPSGSARHSDQGRQSKRCPDHDVVRGDVVVLARATSSLRTRALLDGNHLFHR